MRTSLLQVLGTVLQVTFAAPSSLNPDHELGLHFEKRQGQLPVLKLPYQSFQATKFDKAADVYTFQNIRFG
jgi:hypothetical protein